MEIIDKAQMGECMTGEPELDRDLIRSAIDEIGSRIVDMETSLDMKDNDAWKKHAHRSIGAAATLGFKALADEFRNAEHQAHTCEERRSSLKEIRSLFELTRQELSQLGML